MTSSFPSQPGMARSLGIQTLGAGIAHLSVGPDDTPFDVHLELLCDCSPYFDTLFRDRAAGRIPTDPVRFPDEDPTVFAEVIHWMYQGQLAANLAYRVHVSFLLQLWVLAGMLEIPALQNAAIVLCRKKADHLPRSVLAGDTVDYVYAHTGPDSPLRTLVTDTWMQRGTRQHFVDFRPGLPRAFLDDLCGTLIGRMETCRQADENEPQRYPDERYYVHPRGGRSSPTGKQSSASAETLNIPQPATPAQMRNRKVKSPSPRLHRSRPSSAPSVINPETVVDSKEGEDVATEALENLKI